MDASNGLTAQQVNRISVARTQLLLSHPFYGTLVMSLKNVAAPEGSGVKTAAVDGVHIWWCPEYLDGLTDAELKGVLAHEVMHCVLNHHTRRASRDPKRWNVAGDYLINSVLKAENFVLPKDVLYGPFSIDKDTTESIYSQIPEPPPGSGQGGQGGGQDMDPGGAGGVIDAPAKGTPDVNGDPVGTPQDQAVDWQTKATQAAQMASARGKIAAGLKELIDSLNESRLDWRAVLAEFLESGRPDDYSFRRPNRRFLGLEEPIYLPGPVPSNMGEWVVAIDSSGSVSREMLKAFLSEVQGAMDMLNPERTHVITCDAEVQTHQIFEAGDTLAPEVKGRGGTEFIPVFEHVEAQGLDPLCLVYLSDMECSDFPPEPAYPTLWIRCNPRGRGETAPFGVTVDMDL